MKIGIVTSGSDMLALFKFLSLYDHEYVVYYDSYHRPYGDKSFDEAFACVKKGVEYLQSVGAEAIIVPPVYELKLCGGSVDMPKTGGILPLFSRYLKDSCFAHSLVGKIGFFGDYADMECAQDLLKSVEKHYVLSKNQKSVKKFHFPFSYWGKETPLWKYYLTGLSYSHILVNKILKFDLRYFKDAMTDTVIPLNYGYFHYQTTISKFFNFRKIKFHKLDCLAKVFSSFGLALSKSYAISICSTGTSALLRRDKKTMWQLQKGCSTAISRIDIYSQKK